MEILVLGFIVRDLRRRPPSATAKSILQAQGASLDVIVRMVIVSSMSVIVVMCVFEVIQTQNWCLMQVP